MDTKNYIKEPGVLASYLNHLVNESDVSASTAYNYYMNLRLLAQYLKHERKNMDCEPDEVVMANVSDDEMLSITEDEWDDFLDYCRFTRNESLGSYAVRISIVRGFYRWLCEVHATDVPVFIARAKRPQMVKAKESVEVNEEQKDTIIEHLTGDFATRNVSIILLFLRCGLGLNEIVQLDMEDINLTSVRVERGDDGKSRVVQMDEETAEAIDAYLSDRIPPTTGGNPLFVSPRKGECGTGPSRKCFAEPQRLVARPSRISASETFRARRAVVLWTVQQRSKTLCGSSLSEVRIIFKENTRHACGKTRRAWPRVAKHSRTIAKICKNLSDSILNQCTDNGIISVK